MQSVTLWRMEMIPIPAEVAIEMVERVLENQADMVGGGIGFHPPISMKTNGNFHNFGNALVRKSINKLFKSNIRDIMTGYRAFSYQFVKTFPVLSKGFEIETEMSIHAIDKNMNVANVVVEYRDRPDGSSSKLNTFSDGAKVIRTIVSYSKRINRAPFLAGLRWYCFCWRPCFFSRYSLITGRRGLCRTFLL